MSGSDNKGSTMAEGRQKGPPQGPAAQERPCPRQARATKQNSDHVLNKKEKAHSLSLNSTELISKCEEIDDR